MQEALCDNDYMLLQYLAMRIPRVIASWIVGCIVCLVNSSYDGVLALMFLPFFTAINAAVAVTLSLVLGAVFLNRPFRRFWNATYAPAIILFVVTVLLLSFGVHLGLKQEWVDPDSGQRLVLLHPSVLFGGLLAIVFAVVHWPAPYDNDSASIVDLVVTSLTNSSSNSR